VNAAHAQAYLLLLAVSDFVAGEVARAAGCAGA
jgi:hypothetical protein